MPLITDSSYSKRPFYMLNAHWETIIPSMFYKGPDLPYERQRKELIDGDFLDIDHLKGGNSKCLIITHGLEGDSNRYYVKRTAGYFFDRGWDVIAWNCRSCSGEINRLPRFYHHGETGDLATVIEHSFDMNYDSVVLMGYSMGGSMSLKYLGERAVDTRVKGAITFSVPCNLLDSSETLKLRENQVYEKRFVSKLIEKMKVKAETYPGSVNVKGIDELKDFDDFHHSYTAPLHGFESVDQFFAEATCDRYLPHIKVPVFIGNALNDPMLGEECYPAKLAKESEFVYLETPKLGGHVGFSIAGQKYSWMEVRAEQFMKQHQW
ncbi:MAG: alpha/beta fold hydrolase [Cyclobacteriaceae bacterium]